MSLLRELYYEEELNKLMLNENLVKYYQENPEKKVELINKLKSLENKITSDDEIRNFYKESFLATIGKNVKLLENDRNLSILELGIPFLTFLLGFEAKDRLENFLEKYNREVVSDIFQTVKEELNKYGERRRVRNFG